MTARRWNRSAVEWLAFAGAIAASTLAFHAAWRDIVSTGWTDPEQGQVLLSPMVAAGLIVLRRSELAGLPRSRRWLGPMFFVAAAGASIAGRHSGLQALFHLGAILSVAACATAVWGTAIMRRVLPSLAALLFMVPVPGLLRQSVALPLQQLSASVVAMVFGAAGIPVERSGSLLVLSDQEVMLAEACSGLRMLFALLLASYAVVMARPLSTGRRLALLAATPLFAIILNILRLLPVVLLIRYGPPAFGSLVHDLSGWIMVAGAIAVPMLLLRGEPTLPQCAAASAHPALERPTLASAGTCILLGVGLFFATPGDAADTASVNSLPDPELPYRIGAWIARDTHLPPAALELLKPDAAVSRAYQDLESGRTVHLVLLHCSDARRLVGHWPAACYPARGWNIETATPVAWAGRLASGEGTEFLLAGGASTRGERLRIRSYLMAPSGQIVGDMRLFKAAAEDPRLCGLGGTQLQLIFDADVSPEQCAEVAAQFTATLESAILGMTSR